MIRSTLFSCVLLAATPAFADDGARDMTGKKELLMQNCPSTVPGATTTVADIPGGVTVTVRAVNDVIAQQQIRVRVQFQMQIGDAPDRGSIEHTGFGTGSGQGGFCPGMQAGTALEVSWLSDGALMTIRAVQPDRIKALQKSTHQRARALAARRHKIALR